MNWVLIFLGFSMLIILHEAGHFFAAKATGMRVERFFLFFGPTIWSFKRGETEYGIKSIPLGGYVKITGMNPEEEIPPEIEPRAYYRQPVWKRIVTIAAGPAVNIVLAFLIFYGVFLSGGERSTQTVGEIVPGSPAARVLQDGDRVVAVDGRRYSKLAREERLEKFVDTTSSHRCPGRQVDGCLAKTPVELTLVRDGVTRTISVKPEYDRGIGYARVGFRYGTEPIEYGTAGSARESLDTMWLVASRTVTVFSRLFEEDKRKEVSGVVGVSAAANQTIDISAKRSFLLLGLVSLSLGLINLFPFLPLDGGHILWAVVEKVRGRPVSLRTMEKAGALGFALVIMLFVLGLSNDIGRLTGEGFNVR